MLSIREHAAQKTEPRLALAQPSPASPSEPQTHHSITSDWRLTGVSYPLYCAELYTRSPFRVKNIDVAVAYKVLNCAATVVRFRCGATAELRCN